MVEALRIDIVAASVAVAVAVVAQRSVPIHNFDRFDCWDWAALGMAEEIQRMFATTAVAPSFAAVLTVLAAVAVEHIRRVVVVAAAFADGIQRAERVRVAVQRVPVMLEAVEGPIQRMTER